MYSIRLENACKSQKLPIRKFEVGAVLRIFTLLLLCSPTLSFALGLGDISLKSNLGEPLLAKIAITDTDVIPEQSCFSVADTSDTPAFKSANITLKGVDGNYVMTLSTHDIISEPVVNLRVSIHCEPNLNREYVLLMDPASLTYPDKLTTTTPQIASQEASSTNQSEAKDKVRNRKLRHPATRQNDISTSAERTTQDNGRKKKRINVKATADTRLMEAYTGKQVTEPSIKTIISNKTETQTSEAPISTALASKSRLIISGSGTSSTEGAISPSLSLRMETQLDLTRTETTTPLNSADALDEVTVMANRLAHLEKQIVSLQDQNTRLRNEAEKTKNATLPTFQATNLLPSLPIVAGFIAALAGVIWLRRKILSNRLSKEHASWFDADSDSEHNQLSKNQGLNSNATIFQSIKPNPSIQNQTNENDLSHQDQSGFFSYPSAFTISDNDVSESVLDHTEVFIAHGRPAMAIQLLQNHLTEAPVESPEIWLKLLSLLATEGTEAEYDNAVVACKQFFNIKLPNFADATTIDESTIEDYPHILARLQDVWGSEFAVEFLNDLIFNRQSQPREGFGRSTFEELFFLNQIAISLHASSKFQKRTSGNEPTKAPPPVEITSLEEIMQDYGMSVETEPQINVKAAPTTSQKINNILDDELTAESFFNAPDAVENDLDMQFDFDQNSNVENAEPEATPALALDVLLSSEEKQAANDTLKTTVLNQHLDSPVLEIKPLANTSEIDFSDFLDEINIEAPTDDLSSQEISIAKTALPELEFSVENDALNSPNIIEWEPPKLEPKSKAKTKKEPLS
jgi:hypothetical protein